MRGSVVEIRFDEHLPPVNSVLRVGGQGQVVLEVLAQRDARQVRGIPLSTLTERFLLFPVVPSRGWFWNG